MCTEHTFGIRWSEVAEEAIEDLSTENASLQAQLNTVSKLNDRNYAELLKARERIAELEALPTTTVIGCYCLKLSHAGRPCAICIKAKHDKYKTALEGMLLDLTILIEHHAMPADARELLRLNRRIAQSVLKEGSDADNV